jgi:Family of unknown function (DUF6085)
MTMDELKVLPPLPVPPEAITAARAALADLPVGTCLWGYELTGAARRAVEAAAPYLAAAERERVIQLAERPLPDDRAVEGYCPMGCGRTLFLGSGGYVTCSYVHCPRPDAIPAILADAETEHIVSFGEDAFTIRHPLRERLDDALMDCDLHEHCASLPGPPVQPGKYRARAGEGERWTWQEIR